MTISRRLVCPTILGCFFPLIARIIIEVLVEDSFCYRTSIVKRVVFVKLRARMSTIAIPPPRCASPKIFRVSRWVTTNVYTMDLNWFCPTMRTNFSSTNSTSNRWIQKRTSPRRNQHQLLSWSLATFIFYKTRIKRFGCIYVSSSASITTIHRCCLGCSSQQVGSLRSSSWYASSYLIESKQSNKNRNTKQHTITQYEKIVDETRTREEEGKETILVLPFEHTLYNYNAVAIFLRDESFGFVLMCCSFILCSKTIQRHIIRRWCVNRWDTVLLWKTVWFQSAFFFQKYEKRSKSV